MQKNSAVKNRGAQSGFAMLMLLALQGVAAIILYQMFTLSIVSREQSVVVRDRVRYNALLNSMLDYTIFGIKDRWCFDPTLWVQKPSGCTMFDTGSIDALLAGKDTIQSIGNFNILTTGVPDPLPTPWNEISGSVDFASITSGHPLFESVNSLQTAGATINNLNFSIKRLDDSKFPIRGRESLLEIKVSLVSISGPIFKDLATLSATARVMVTPRELGSFALVVAKDLHMEVGGTGGPGDFNIPPSTGGQGITFESPVFVNGNVYLPPAGTYSETIFNDKLYLGEGRIFQSGVVYAPPTAGAPSQQTYSDIPEFGGFTKGVDYDGKSDDGLKVMIGTMPASPAAADTMAKCRPFNDARLSLQKTADADLLVKDLSPGSGKHFQFELALNQLDRFQPQEYPRQVGIGSVDPVTFLSAMDPDVVMRTKLVVEVLDPLGGPNKIRTYVLELGPNSQAQAVISTTVTMDVMTTPIDDNRVKFDLKFTGPPTQLVGARIALEAYDYGTFAGFSRRYERGSGGTGALIPGLSTPGYSREGEIFLIPTAPVGLTVKPFLGPSGGGYYKTAATATAPVNMTYPPDAIYDGYNYGDFSLICQYGSTNPKDIATRNKVNESFTSADFNNENVFLASTRSSWNFATFNGPNMIPDDQPFPASSVHLMDDKFVVRSIVGTCIIQPTVDLVTGFYTCDHLVISPRSSPLTIIGTIIANRATIDASAVSSGIKFKAIYHPEAVNELRSNNILLDFFGAPCGLKPTVPIWHPAPSVVDQHNMQSCNPVSLRAKADPFTWTAVTPDCGFAPGTGQVSCLRKPQRYQIQELSRVADIQ